MTRPNLKKTVLEDLVESFFIAYNVNLTLTKTFQNSRQNSSENELRSLFVAKEAEAFSQNFVLVMQNFLVILHYFKSFTQEFYINTQKLYS